ncbi:MAG: FABP family protein, partial [Nitrospirota bacterium]|nr:FABP family protein [Nitrospirota bacterium]
MTQQQKELGPLAALAGIWEGQKGDDTAPSDDRGTEQNKYRERITFEPIGSVNNHEQTLYGLRYATTAWRIGEETPFHEEVGYWLWDPKEKQVLRCFIVPR